MDGASVGTSIATLMLSLALNITIPSDLAMSGAITLEGQVLAVGSVEEKLKAAKKGGVKKVFLPAENQTNVENLDLKEEIEIVFVSKYEDIFNSVFK